MATGNQLLLLTREDDTERAVSQACNGPGRAPVSVVRVHEVAQLASRLDAAPHALVIVDVDPGAAVSLAALAPVIARHPQTRFVVLCTELRNDVLLEAMQTGARHCLVKRTLSADLPPVIARLLADAAPEQAGTGRIITVLTASGGCGGTTVAINLAEECRQASGGKVLLMDLDDHYGAVASYLGLKGSFGVTDVLDHKGTIDSTLISSTAAAFGDDFRVLLSPASVNFPAPTPISWERLRPALAACRHAFPDTIVDAPRVRMDVAADLARSSALTLIVFELAVIDIRSTRAMLNALADRNVPSSSVLPVANRCTKRNTMLGLQDARDALGGLEVGRVGNDYASAIKSINFGQPVARVAPRSTLRDDIKALLDRARPTPAGLALSNGHAATRR